MNLRSMFDRYKRAMLPPYTKRDSLSILVTLLIVLLIPLTIISLNSRSATRSDASAVPVVRGQEGDLWADIVIGKRDFGEISPGEVAPDRVYQPGGVIVDKSVSPGRMYVWDSSNNRILGFDLGTCYGIVQPGNVQQKCSADIVIGQPSVSDYGACNQDSSNTTYPEKRQASSSSLCGVRDSTYTVLEDKSFVSMWTDSEGNLYVPDMHNHRVLKFNKPFETDQVADEVWGQSDFSANACNLGDTRLCLYKDPQWGAGVFVDTSGNLWVADGGNNRVVRFPAGSKTADLVLGQSGMNSRIEGSNLNQMRGPTAVRMDSSGKLYVADNSNERVLVFTPPFSSGMQASGTIGSGFQRNGEGIVGLEIDPLIDGILTLDNPASSFDSRLRVWGFDGSLKSTNVADGNKGGGSVGIDTQGNLLVAVWNGGQNIYRLKKQADGSFCCDRGNDRLLKYPYGYNLLSPRRLQAPSGTGVAINGDQLVVADGRLLFWNGLSTLSNGKEADGYAGAVSFSEIPQPQYHQIKSSQSHIWAAKGTEIHIFNAPLTSGAVPVKKLTSPVSTLNGEQLSFGEIIGVAPTTDGQYLWVSEPRKHRVFRVRDPLTTTPVVDVILGQSAVSGQYCNRNSSDSANNDPWATPNPSYVTLNTLCHPGMLAIDKNQNLYVSDHIYETAGNKRLLMFSSNLFASSSGVLFAPNATKEFPASGGHNHMTFEPAFNSQNNMVVGYNPYSGERYVGYYVDPTKVNSNNPKDPAFAQPSGFLRDFTNWPIAMTFDSNDNLYAYDANRGQVRIYKKPVFAVVPTPTVASEFNNVSSVMGEANAVFTFSYAGTTSNFIVDASTLPDMSRDVYGAFAQGSQSPIVVSNPQARWDKYRCGNTLYWRVYNADRSHRSPIQSSMIECVIPTSIPTLIPSPTPTITPTPTLLPSPTPTRVPTPTTPLITSIPTQVVDTIPPTVVITSPLHNTTVKRLNTITIKADAADATGVTKVEFYVNGVRTCTDTTASYTCNWRVPNIKGASYNLTANAYDPRGNVRASTGVRVTAQ